jgi:hypothetical protein
LSTYTNGFWENTNIKLRHAGFCLNKDYPLAIVEEPKEKLSDIKGRNGTFFGPPEPQIKDHKPILRVVNHIDNFKFITMKTTILPTLKAYYT